MLTVNLMPAFIRQVVNDARQNKPSTKVHPVDSKGDPETAEIYNGILRHIEYNSSADIAYDTAVDSAVTMSFGYWRISLDYAHDDTFDMELGIRAVSDPFTIYGDPWATSVDGSDWNTAFVVERMSLQRFEREYPGADRSSWSSADDMETTDWRGKDMAQLAEYWTREESEREIVQLSDGSVVTAEQLLTDEKLQEELAVQGIAPIEGRTRTVPGWKVKQCIVSDSEVLSKRDWPGKYIPIVPVYGDEVNEEGKRHFRSLIRDSKDPQRMMNYWRSEATYLLALAPKAPYLGRKGSFATDAARWATANTEAHPYLEYDGQDAPQRQQLDATALGAIQQAMTAQDDMKATMGIFDAARGQRSNETSGKAILARQRESDTATFHFIDNLTRSIRHSGRILIDLIPHVWPDERIVRLMGEDGTASEQKVNGPVPAIGENGQPEMEPDPSQLPQMGPDGRSVQPQRPKMRTFSLTQGKYDLTASAGPSYTTKRQEAAEQMMQLIQAVPSAAPLIGDLLVKNLDWPGADEIADRLKAMLPPQANAGGLPPELQQAMEQGKKLIAQLQQENAALRADKQADMMKAQIDATKAKTDAYKAETERGTKLAELGAPLAVIERFMTPMSILDEAAQPQPPAPQQPMQRPPMPNGGQPF